MPGEEEILILLADSSDLHSQFSEFFGKDYTGEGTDRVPYPTGRSLVSKDGSFHLYRLTLSPLYAEIQKFAVSIGNCAGKLRPATPGVAAFHWIRNVIQWLGKLNDSVAEESGVNTDGTSAAYRRLVIPVAFAKELLAEAEQFSRFPDDLPRTLAKHFLRMSVRKDTHLVLRTLKGGAHQSVGAMTIRWFQFLHQALKADVGRYSKWISDVRGLCNGFSTAVSGLAKDSDDRIRTSYFTYTKLTHMLDDCTDLVVLPPKSDLAGLFGASGGTFLGNLESTLKEYLTHERAQGYARREYSDVRALLRDRISLLNALVDRRSSVASLDIDNLKDSAPKEGHFRLSARSVFERTLRRSMETMGLPKSNSDAIFSCCAVKAWEVENALFDQFKNEEDTERLSDDYRDQARLVKKGLENVRNLHLSARFLMGDLSVGDLLNITTGRQTNEIGKRIPSEINRRSSAPSSDAASRQNGIASSSPVKAATAASNVSTVSKDPGLPSLKRSRHETEALSTAKSRRTNYTREEPDGPRFTAGGLPPPPPPSLVASLARGQAFGGTNSSTDQPNGSGSLVSTSTSSLPNLARARRTALSSGPTQFRLVMKEGAFEFLAHFQIEVDRLSLPGAGFQDNFFPACLRELGQARISGLTEFFQQKLLHGKGRWVASTARVLPASSRDAREHRKFCSNVESRDKCCLLSTLDESDDATSNEPTNKVYLVTPKFHNALAVRDQLQFQHPTNSYIVLLSKV
jgi:hypothetical protein